MQHEKEIIAEIFKENTSAAHAQFSFFVPTAFAGLSGYVDGGNACVLQTPWYAVHLVRGACCTLKGTSLASFKQWDFFLVARQKEDGCTIKTFGAPSFFECPSFLKASCNDAGAVVREQFEKSILFWAKGLSVEFFVIDGLTATQKEFPFPVIGLAKTTGEGSPALVQQPGIWIAEANNMFFCQLHPSAYAVFRISGDIHAEKVLAYLAFLSRDLIFPGYPYGLIVADQFARVSNHERDYALCIFEGYGGKKWGNVIRETHFTTAHAVLDKVL